MNRHIHIDADLDIDSAFYKLRGPFKGSYRAPLKGFGFDKRED